MYVAFERQNNNFNLRAYRNGAWYSLDLGDDIETEAINLVSSAENEFMALQDKQSLYDALARLSDKQARRIYAHYFLGLSKSEIARKEGVNRISITNSITYGLKNLKKFLD